MNDNDGMGLGLMDNTNVHGFIYENLNMEFLSTTISYFGSFLMIFGGLMPFVPQYRDIKRTQNADGFSLFVCLALLLANTMRILFWFGHRFELPLLLQSIVMNIAMFAMIQLCIRVKSRTQIVPTQSQVFTDIKKEELTEKTANLEHEKLPISRVFLGMLNIFGWRMLLTILVYVITHFDKKYFWAWTDFLSYVECIATFSAAVGAVVYLFIEVPFVIEGIGLLALLTEAMLGVPQFYRNFKNKSTLGMSKKMVFMWTIGDVFKTTYFILKEVPRQFWVCGILQIAIDIAIMLQIAIYQITPQRLLKPGKHVS